MDRIKKYIEEYDFEAYLDGLEKILVEEKYQEFTLDFWDNPSLDMTKLKSKHTIKNTVSISDILMQNPTQKYYSLLNDVWKERLNTSKLIEKYLMSVNRIEQIIFPLIYDKEECFCPRCLENKFKIEYKVRNNMYSVKCIKCGYKGEEFLSKKQKEEIEQADILRKQNFDNKMSELKDRIEFIKCHKCQSDIQIVSNEEEFTYIVVCKKCRNCYKSVEEAEVLYKEWKQRAAIMINIKEKEKELLQKSLELKDETQVKLKFENIITRDESIDAILGLAKLEEEVDDICRELIGRYVISSRLDRAILLEICKEGLKGNFVTTTWRNGERYLTELVVIKYEEPLVYELMNRSKMIPIRKILRRLIAQCLVYCDEETNEIHIHPLLIENFKQLEDINKPQNINSQIAYLVFTRQKYVCYHCGCTGRPLKIAYLTMEKDINDLSSLVAICDTCYEDITEDEVLVDNIISMLAERSNELGQAWKFLIEQDKSFRGDSGAEIEHRSLYDEYDTDNLIKAYAIALYKKSKDGFANDRAFFSYVRGVLANAKDEVNVYPIVREKYKLNQWLER
ncbi:MAG: hypothetical protein KHY44_14890 [Clostridiales bacterium]|jgi:Zn ribbon nucleic-acid-binding protein|nr:hypothetical protein [Clostridiales bacterium]